LHRKPTKSQDKIDYVRVYRMKTDSYKTLSYTSTTVADDLLKAMCEKVTKISRAEIINQKKKKKKKADIPDPEKYALYESIDLGGTGVGPSVDRILEPNELISTIKGFWKVTGVGTGAKSKDTSSSVPLERRLSIRLKRTTVHPNLEKSAQQVGQVILFLLGGGEEKGCKMFFTQ